MSEKEGWSADAPASPRLLPLGQEIRMNETYQKKIMQTLVDYH